ncbi:ShlB/FhaC/HecB family hemolysin secretion/activation protein [Caenimonas koreensis]|uniref:ShlB/FhaC/HecB family hemolysin secretion/activation protein n=1 Tax=Caenimonas koreensis TaxID=367474 RepID=UPI003784C50D
MFIVRTRRQRWVLRGNLSLAALAFCQVAAAQQPPGAGSQLLQIPAAPVQPRTAPQMRIEERTASTPVTSDEVKLRVQSLRVTGSTAFTEPALVELTGFVAGSELTLSQLQAMAEKITGLYRRNGYFAAHAYVPAQEIKDGAVHIAVSEGRYGAIALRNNTNLSDSIAQGALDGVNRGDLILAEPLERHLLLLSDLPGITLNSTLAPGAVAGTSDLLVEVSPGARVNGSIDIDNGGSRFTGRYRIGATVNVNEPLGLGDVASLRLLTSGHGLQYARASWQRQLGRGQVGVAYSWLGYELGEEFAPLGAHGTAQVASVFGRYPLMRSRNSNMHAQLGFDWKTFNDRIDATGSEVDRKSRVLTASVLGDRTDAEGGGYTTYFAGLSAGSLDIETPSARAADALTARANGGFSKIVLNATRTQRLGSGTLSIYGSIGGQLASKNLDSSEKLVLGGTGGVRAFSEGQAYADEGVLVSLELRDDLPRFTSLPGYMQLVGFVDAASVTIDHSPWVAGSNHRTLSGAGVGVNWSDPGNFLVRAYYAHTLGGKAAPPYSDRAGRFYFQLVKYF